VDEARLHPLPFAWLYRPTPSCAGAGGTAAFESLTVPGYPDGPSSQARGEALHRATVGVPATIEIEVRDRFGNPLRGGMAGSGWVRPDNSTAWSDTDVITAVLEPVVDAAGEHIHVGSPAAVEGRLTAMVRWTGGQAGGLWTATYTPTTAGRYRLELLIAHTEPDLIAPPGAVEAARAINRVPGSPFDLIVSPGSATGQSSAWG